jgi:hypothetical protein
VFSPVSYVVAPQIQGLMRIVSVPTLSSGRTNPLSSSEKRENFESQVWILRSPTRLRTSKRPFLHSILPSQAGRVSVRRVTDHIISNLSVTGVVFFNKTVFLLILGA